MIARNALKNSTILPNPPTFIFQAHSCGIEFCCAVNSSVKLSILIADCILLSLLFPKEFENYCKLLLLFLTGVNETIFESKARFIRILIFSNEEKLSAKKLWKLRSLSEFYNQFAPTSSRSTRMAFNRACVIDPACAIPRREQRQETYRSLNIKHVPFTYDVVQPTHDIPREINEAAGDIQ
uniref:AsIV-cont00117-ORF1 n=1 Tax=Apophua simplicipes ichnovirus TaxID=1329648 RepID=S5DMQ0_9VIRU|nr:AsIV-cont00117-ORF1 [Apophua simplicipes ichnovirus]